MMPLVRRLPLSFEFSIDFSGSRKSRVWVFTLRDVLFAAVLTNVERLERLLLDDVTLVYVLKSFLRAYYDAEDVSIRWVMSYTPFNREYPKIYMASISVTKAKAFFVLDDDRDYLETRAFLVVTEGETDGLPDEVFNVVRTLRNVDIILPHKS